MAYDLVSESESWRRFSVEVSSGDVILRRITPIEVPVHVGYSLNGVYIYMTTFVWSLARPEH